MLINFKLRHICVFSIQKFMKSKKNLVLLGMMGSGKSTIGILVSKKLNVSFIDIDKLIEKESNMKITEIFDQKGEAFFRKLEENTTLKALSSTNKIISLGGGGFLNEKIRKEIILNNMSIWLNWNNQTLLNRIKKSKKRPMAFNLNEKELLELILIRNKTYSKAKIKIDCEKFSKNKIVSKIIGFYELK